MQPKEILCFLLLKDFDLYHKLYIFYDEEILQWCFEKAGRPTDEQMEIWSTFVLKRGWRDGSTPFLEQEKQASGFGDREDIVTWSDLQKAEEA